MTLKTYIANSVKKINYNQTTIILFLSVPLLICFSFISLIDVSLDGWNHCLFSSQFRSRIQKSSLEVAQQGSRCAEAGRQMHVNCFAELGHSCKTLQQRLRLAFFSTGETQRSQASVEIKKEKQERPSITHFF